MTCSICRHSQRASIESALVAGEPGRAIARQFGVSRSALQRHADNHLPSKLIEGKAAAEVLDADRLLSEMQDLQRRTLAILARAEAKGNLAVALGAIRESRQNLELLARLIGSLIERHAIAAAIHATVRVEDEHDAVAALMQAIAAIDDPSAERVLDAA